MRRRRRHHLPAFSLIEVLIAVLVLGIGMLGLAAVFPVVITQQRNASDVIMGGVASTAIRGQIRSNPEVARELLSQDGYADADEPDLDGDRAPNDPDDANPDVVGTGEPIFGVHPSFQFNAAGASDPEFNPRTGYSYLWEGDWDWGIRNSNASVGPITFPLSDGGFTLQDYLDDGALRFRDPGERDSANLSASDPDLPLAARLYPPAFSNPEGGKQDGPQFVWDFVPRRTPSGAVQLAVFVRRIDTGIRVPDGRTLSDLLLDENESLKPVGWDLDTGTPTRDGTGAYSIPLTAQAQAIPSADYPERLESLIFQPSQGNQARILVLLDGVRLSVGADSQVSTASDIGIIRRLLARRGQRFVDNLGVVREVVEVLGGESSYVDIRVNPPFTLNDLPHPAFTVGPGDPEPALETYRSGKLRQVVFTPQVPIDVFVMEFSR